MGRGKDKSFSIIEERLSFAPFLTLLIFEKPFEMETDACMVRIEAMLIQDGKPVKNTMKSLTRLG